MKIFVSSRMEEVFTDRAVAIATIHHLGHIPLYIETEPKSKTKELKDSMDRLISQADALLLIFYLSEGDRTDILNKSTPIEYEYSQFVALHPSSPVFLFQKTPPSGCQSTYALTSFFRSNSEHNGHKIVEYRSHTLLAGEIQARIARATKQRPRVKSDGNRFVILYSGPDFLGLVGAISEHLFKNHGVNIDYISSAGQGGLNSLYISFSFLEEDAASTINLDSLKESLRQVLIQELALATIDKRLLSGADARIEEIYKSPFVQILRNDSVIAKEQFYLEIRTIDAPGQLNALCKLLRALGYNIDEIVQKPTSPEFERQSLVTLWLSKYDCGLPVRCKDNLIELETGIGSLVGVRSFSLRFVKHS